MFFAEFSLCFVFRFKLTACDVTKAQSLCCRRCWGCFQFFFICSCGCGSLCFGTERQSIVHACKAHLSSLYPFRNSFCFALPFLAAFAPCLVVLCLRSLLCFFVAPLLYFAGNAGHTAHLHEHRGLHQKNIEARGTSRTNGTPVGGAGICLTYLVR